MGYVFVSYSHKDTEYAHSFSDKLQSMGFDVWIDERLDYGSTWPQEIQKQLDSCSAFIVIMSPRSFESEWVQNELNRAKRLGKPIYPLLLEGNGPWLSVESTQFADVRNGSFPDEKFYKNLEEVIPRKAGQAASDISVPAKTAVTLSRKLNIPLFAGIGMLVLIILGAINLSKYQTSDVVETPDILSNIDVETEVSATELSEEEVVPTGMMPSIVDEVVGNEFVDAKGIAMVFVPAGNFIVGSDTGYDDEKPVHTYHLNK